VWHPPEEREIPRQARNDRERPEEQAARGVDNGALSEMTEGGESLRPWQVALVAIPVHPVRPSTGTATERRGYRQTRQIGSAGRTRAGVPLNFPRKLRVGFGESRLIRHHLGTTQT
jgi:hypothetical protein